MKVCGGVEVEFHAFMSAIDVHDVRESHRKPDLFIYLSYLHFFKSRWSGWSPSFSAQSSMCCYVLRHLFCGIYVLCTYVCKVSQLFRLLCFKKVFWAVYLISVFVFDLNAHRITCGSNSSIPLNSETRVPSQNSRHWTCGGKSGMGIAFSLSSSVFARQYYFIKSSHWYFPYLSVMLYNLSSLQLRQANHFSSVILPEFC